MVVPLLSSQVSHVSFTCIWKIYLYSNSKNNNHNSSRFLFSRFLQYFQNSSVTPNHSKNLPALKTLKFPNFFNFFLENFLLWRRFYRFVKSRLFFSYFSHLWASKNFISWKKTDVNKIRIFAPFDSNWNFENRQNLFTITISCFLWGINVTFYDLPDLID